MTRSWPSPLALMATGLVMSAGAEADPRPDPNSIVTIQIENDAVSTLKGTSDQYYTSGLRLGYVSPTGALPDVIADFGHAVFGAGAQRISIDLGQSVFTPRNTQLNPPNPSDRPYAGALLLTGGLIQDTDTSRNLFALSLGVVGPSALGEELQNGFHSIIGNTANRGWHYQIQDQPAIQLLEQRTWRLPVLSLAGMEVDTLPAVTVAAGDVRDYVQAGLSLRIGQGLDSDFGAPRIVPGLSGADAYAATQPFAWYVFAGADGQLVGYDVTLDGSTFRHNSPGVHRIFDVGEMQAGLAVMAFGLRVTYTQTWRTQEFRGQKGGLFNFGSLAVSAKF